MQKSLGKIFNIQRFSIYDGPGVRTTVFFKGCNLNCSWCHNPESISFNSQLEFYPEKCISCGKCFEVCPNKAHYISNNIHKIDRTKCKLCFTCVDSCYAEALIKVGTEMIAEELFNEIYTDEEYFKNSSGGVTFSGGECMVQIDFLTSIAKICHEHKINVAIDTAGNVPFEYFEKIIDYTDWFLYDIKAINSDVHKKITGVDNSLIIENLKKLSALNKKIIIRIPYIPSINDNEMADIADFLSSISVDQIEILSFHRLGDGKYSALGETNFSCDVKIPTNEELKLVEKIFLKRGLNVIIK